MNYIIDEAQLTAIADAIREKTGESNTMTVDEMPDEIDSIESGGDTRVIMDNQMKSGTGIQFSTSQVQADLMDGSVTWDQGTIGVNGDTSSFYRIRSREYLDYYGGDITINATDIDGNPLFIAVAEYDDSKAKLTDGDWNQPGAMITLQYPSQTRYIRFVIAKSTSTSGLEITPSDLATCVHKYNVTSINVNYGSGLSIDNQGKLIANNDVYTKTQTNALLSAKADLSMFTPMTQAEYDALENKDLPIYIVYEE